MVLKFFKNIRDKIKNLSKDGDKSEPENAPKRAKQAPAPLEKRQAGRSRKRSRRRKKKKVAEQIPVAEWDVSQFEVEPAEGKTRFHDLELPDEIMHAVFDLGYRYCTPIQSEVIPSLLTGRDAFGQAQTGTGKTAAFLIATFTNMLRNPITWKRKNGEPRALVLAPTRELAVQISEEAEALTKYCDIGIATVFGGMDYDKQKRSITGKTVDIVVGTPGRLIDYIRHRDLDVGKLEVLVIDEGDRMLDMGFIPQVRRIIRSTPQKKERQTLLFSATLSDDVTRLASYWTKNPVKVEIEPEKVEVDSVEQIVYLTTTDEKAALLYNIIVRQDLNRAIVFCNMKSETRRLAELMRKHNINCALLSGDVPQKKRIRTLENFKAGNIRVLIATDVAGRGLHIEGISHVINYTLPNDPENYVHRIGRTGRAGATGTSISFACEEDSFYIPDIEEFLGHKLNCTYPEEEWLKIPPPPDKKPGEQKKKKRRRRRKKPAGTRRTPPESS